MAGKAGVKNQKSSTKKSAKKETRFFEYFHFGESYTSLILGIIVVIIGTALLLSFIHNKNAGNVNVPISQQTQNTVQVSQSALDLVKAPQKGEIDGTITAAPTDTIAPTSVPTVQPTPKLIVKPTKPIIKSVVKPTVKPMSKSVRTLKAKPTAKPVPTQMIKKIAHIQPSPTVVPQVKTDKDNNIWIVQKGESLWTIAEKKYSSGYNWVDIAKANNLADPSNIHVGDRLILPSVAPKATTIVVKPSVKVTPVLNVQKNTTIVAGNGTNKITGNTYTVVKGDNLWNIAVRAYGDGYKWTAIAQANNLTNPHLIFSGNRLTIPR